MQDKPMAISQFIDDSPLSRYQIMVLALCFIIVLLDGFDTAAIGYIAPELISQWGISRGQLAPAFGAGLFGMLIGNFAFGPVAPAGPQAGAAAVHADLRSGHAGLGPGGVHRGAGAAAPRHRHRPGRRAAQLHHPEFGILAGAPPHAAGHPQLCRLHRRPGAGRRRRQPDHPAVGLARRVGGRRPGALLLPFMVWLLPESVCYLAGRPEQLAALRRIVARINPDPRWQQQAFRREDAAQGSRSPAALLFVAGVRARTLLLWLTFFCCLFVFYLLTNWMPTILRDMATARRRRRASAPWCRWAARWAAWSWPC